MGKMKDIAIEVMNAQADCSHDLVLVTSRPTVELDEDGDKRFLKYHYNCSRCRLRATQIWSFVGLLDEHGNRLE